MPGLKSIYTKIYISFARNLTFTLNLYLIISQYLPEIHFIVNFELHLIASVTFS